MTSGVILMMIDIDIIVIELKRDVSRLITT